MSKEEIVGLIMKHLKVAVPDFGDECVAMDKTYKELGIASLDLVEIVSNTMRDMGVRLSPAELAQAKTTGDLVTLLLQAST